MASDTGDCPAPYFPVSRWMSTTIPFRTARRARRTEMSFAECTGIGSHHGAEDHQGRRPQLRGGAARRAASRSPRSC